jgi:nitrite reductase (NADH) small subunit
MRTETVTPANAGVQSSQSLDSDFRRNDDRWKRICALTDIPRLGARVVNTEGGDVAIFRNAADEVFALHDSCPHKGGPLSQGIVFGRHVSCPLHQWIVCLETGRAQEPDEGCTRSFAVKVEQGQVFLRM